MSVDRRTLLFSVAAAGGVGAAAIALRGQSALRPRADIKNLAGRPNVILITSDQERAWSMMPPGFIDTHCPARRWLAENGISFTRAVTPSQLCSTARGTIYTGAHPQTSAVWENVPLPYATDIRDDIPTVGTLFQDAGYETAYAGKWHLSRLGRRGTPLPPEDVRELVNGAGFDHSLTEAEIDGPRAGFLHDEETVKRALSLANRRGDSGKPLFMAVNLVNPHDIMYYAYDRAMIDSREVRLQPIVLNPDDPLYQQDLGYDVIGPYGPSSRTGRPFAVEEYVRAYEKIFGVLDFSDDEAARHFQNTYWNMIRDSDRRLMTLLDGLDTMGALEDTVIVFTSDHGEFLGAHGMRGKGVTPYRESTQVPMIVVHPEGPGGTESEALISHVDLAPTLLGLAGIDAGAALADLPQMIGRDLSPEAGGTSGLGPRAEEGVLLHWTSLAFIDHRPANVFEEVSHREGLGKLISYWQMTRHELTEAADNRGQMRGVWDGRYKFARYFSPKEHHRPHDWETLTSRNDIEFYDTAADPEERNNLASDGASRTAVLAMNEKLNALIDREIGVDDGSFLPSFARA